MRNRLPLGSLRCLLAATFVLSACSPAEPPVSPTPPAPSAAPAPVETAAPAASAAPAPAAAPGPSVESLVKQFAPAVVTADVTKLAPSERKALEKLIAAGKLLEPIFNRQVVADYDAMRAKLAADPAQKSALTYFDIMRGPWDRQDHFRPFTQDRAHPRGAGFYPEDMTEKEYKAWIAAHPEDKAAFDSLTTVIVRDGAKLKAVPFHVAYAAELKPASALLLEAAKLTTNASLKKFLTSRAAAFLSDDYYQSDKDWMDLDSAVEITIGPYETYEDDLFGAKGSYEAFITVTDPAASAKLSKYKKLLPDMEKNLPIPKEMHATRGAESPIRVVDLVFTAGDARKSVQTAAFNLPNDEKVRAEKGSKKVMLRNVIESKFDLIMRPIAEKILAKEQLQYLSTEAFFSEILFHELSHALGPAYTMKDGKKVDVRSALESSYAALEECKADVMGAYNVLYMTKRKEFPAGYREKLLLTYFGQLFRSVRFGVAEAHGQGAAVQINRFLDEGGAKFDEATGRFSVDFDKLEASITKLVHDLCALQHAGDKAAADAMLAKFGVMSGPMKKVVAQLEEIPVDLNPRYPLAGE